MRRVRRRSVDGRARRPAPEGSGARARPAALRWRAVVAASALLACGHTDARVPAPPPALDRGSVPEAADERADGFLLRQRIEFRAPGHEGSFEAVVQQSCGQLSVVGLAPFGARAFTLRDTPSGPEVETYLPLEWPFPPLYILEDVRRTYGVPMPEVAPPDGVRHLRWRGIDVEEHWRGGRLISRSFEEGTPDGPARAHFEYPGGVSPDGFPTRVRVRSERHGYQLDVRTLSRTDLRCPH